MPVNGFWNTRPISRARRCSLHRVTSRPSRNIRPRPCPRLPAMAPSRLDFPEPLVPRTTVKLPRANSRSIASSARTSFGVPGWKTWETASSRRATSGTAWSPLGGGSAAERAAQRFGRTSTARTNRAVTSLSAFGREPGPHGDGDQQAKHQRASHRPRDPAPERRASPAASRPPSASPRRSPRPRSPSGCWRILGTGQAARRTSAISPLETPSPSTSIRSTSMPTPWPSGVAARPRASPVPDRCRGRARGRARVSPPAAPSEEFRDLPPPTGVPSSVTSAGEAERTACPTRSANVTMLSVAASETLPAAHEEQVDGVQRRAGEHPGQQRIYQQLGVKEAGDGAGHGTRHGAQGSGASGGACCTSRAAVSGRADAERPVGGEIERAIDAVADEDAERERRENEPDRRRTDQQIHGAAAQPTG